MRTFMVETLGCKTNAADSERVAGLLRARGLVPVGAGGRADVRVVNTCSVTTAAAAQSRAASRKSARVGAPLTIVMGCWATSDPWVAGEIPGVTLITHHDDLEARLDAALAPYNLPRRTPLPVLGESRARQRAYLKIQDGCDAHCTYCIIPQLRSKLWSLSPAQAVDEARKLLDQGHAEIILTGIFLGAFGQPTALRRRQTGSGYLAELVESLCTQLPHLPRLRLSSIEPGDLTPELLAVLSDYPQVVPHFHIPLQSGSDAILRRMNRQYTRADFLDLVDRLNAAFDRPALTTDILTGFPGEDDGDFADTLAVVEHARFIHIHAFPFSPRPGTAASRWTSEFVHNATATERVRELTRRAEVCNLEFRRGFVGELATVIVEKDLAESGRCHGRTERYFDLELTSGERGTGEIVRVRIDRVEGVRTEGSLA
jgi:threonylcarbamoyladenosine tRNA methylthiotransferase MtaB